MATILTWIKLGDTTFNLHSIVAIRSLGDDHTAVWCAGQSAIDGNFIVEESVKTVEELLEKAHLMELAEARGYATPDEGDDEAWHELLGGEAGEGGDEETNEVGESGTGR